MSYHWRGRRQIEAIALLRIAKRSAESVIPDFAALSFNIIGQVVLPIKFCLSGIMGSFAEDVDMKEAIREILREFCIMPAWKWLLA